jgi:DNA-binding XRE family transcriptional regulator
MTNQAVAPEDNTGREVAPDVIPALLAAEALDSAGGTRQSPHWIAVVDSQQLRQVRLQRGLSQERLAWESGISLTTVGKLERQTRPSCHVRTLALIAAALGAPPSVITVGGRPVPGGNGD